MDVLRVCCAACNSCTAISFRAVSIPPGRELWWSSRPFEQSGVGNQVRRPLHLRRLWSCPRKPLAGPQLVFYPRRVRGAHTRTHIDDDGNEHEKSNKNSKSSNTAANTTTNTTNTHLQHHHQHHGHRHRHPAAAATAAATATAATYTDNSDSDRREQQDFIGLVYYGGNKNTLISIC